MSEGIRLQKFLAQAGVASRRRCEELIEQGRVSVNGEMVTRQGVTVLHGDVVEFDGVRVNPPTEESHVYILLNKPQGYVTTVEDRHAERTVMELVSRDKRIFPVGRLDMNTEGLIILTDDGDFANFITHPRYGCTKEYFARCRSAVNPEDVDRIREGVDIGDGVITSPCEVISVGKSGNDFIVRIKEGRKRQIRRMFEAVGTRVAYLRRRAIGPIRDEELPLGRWRYLTDSEIEALGYKVSRE